MKKNAFILLAGSLLMFNSCTKTGPQGPQGPTGSTGATGAQGNANVKGSDPFDATIWTFSSSENAYFDEFTDADITPDVVDRGVVQIFLFYPAGSSWSSFSWRALPDIYNGTQFYFKFTDNKFRIYYSNVDGTTPSAPTGTWTFRVVVISPSNKQSHPNTNWNNYNEAMAALKDSQSAPVTQ